MEWVQEPVLKLAAEKIPEHHRRRFQKALLVGGGLVMACVLSKVVMQTLLRVSMLFQVVTAFRNMLVLGVRKQTNRKTSRGKSHTHYDKGILPA